MIVWLLFVGAPKLEFCEKVLREAVRYEGSGILGDKEISEFLLHKILRHTLIVGDFVMP